MAGSLTRDEFSKTAKIEDELRKAEDALQIAYSKDKAEEDNRKNSRLIEKRRRILERLARKKENLMKQLTQVEKQIAAGARQVQLKSLQLRRTELSAAIASVTRTAKRYASELSMSEKRKEKSLFTEMKRGAKEFGRMAEEKKQQIALKLSRDKDRDKSAAGNRYLEANARKNMENMSDKEKVLYAIDLDRKGISYGKEFLQDTVKDGDRKNMTVESQQIAGMYLGKEEIDITAFARDAAAKQSMAMDGQVNSSVIGHDINKMSAGKDIRDVLKSETKLKTLKKAVHGISKAESELNLVRSD